MRQITIDLTRALSVNGKSSTHYELTVARQFRLFSLWNKIKLPTQLLVLRPRGTGSSNLTSGNLIPLPLSLLSLFPLVSLEMQQRSFSFPLLSSIILSLSLSLSLSFSLPFPLLAMKWLLFQASHPESQMRLNEWMKRSDEKMKRDTLEKVKDSLDEKMHTYRQTVS